MMPDVVDSATRSRMMAGIGSRDTRPELALRRALHARGLIYRLHDRKLPGTPDLVFRRFGAVCFVHGCFWHRHAGCSCTTTPSTHRDFWQGKFDQNVERDRRSRRSLLDAGWRVGTVWECALRTAGASAVAAVVDRCLRGADREFETSLRSRKPTGSLP